MDRILRFKRHLQVEPLDAERTFLISERDRFLLRGAAYARVAPLIDGRRTEGQILEALGGILSPPEVLHALMLLEARGHVVEVADSFPPEIAGLWEAAGVDAAVAAERLAATPVAVGAVAGEDAGAIAEALAAAGVKVEDDASICVVVTPDYLDAGLAVLAEQARLAGHRFFPLKVAGIACWMGPMIRGPGHHGGPCFACLATRIRANRPVEAYLERRRQGPVRAPRVGLPATARAAVNLAALTLARWIVDGGLGSVNDTLLTFEATTLRVEEHPVTRRPQCPVCGDPGMVSRRALEPIPLSSRPKRFTLDGGHRAVPPEETLARHQRHLSPITGVLSDLRDVGGDDPHRRVYSAVFRVCPSTSTPSFEDFHRLGSGKGRTAVQARAGALAEAIERYSACFQGDEHRLRARFSDLGDEAVHPDVLQGFSEAQLREGTRGDPHREPWRMVPRPYQDQVIDWTAAWSLTRERRCYVPTTFAYLAAPAPPEEQVCHFNSNGNAAGNTLEEAILQGFLELVERDAVAVWWYNRVVRPGVDLAAFDDPYFTEVERRYRSLGADLWVLDLTHDLGIPVFTAVVSFPSTGRCWTGCGAHFDARLAVQRALTEVNQCFDPREPERSPWDPTILGEAPHLAPAGLRAPGPAAPPSDDLLDDVRASVARAAAAGMETLVIDQTRPDVGLTAVKVIVPGLRHFWPRFAPGRLYDVPVRMGWSAAPRAEADLNQVPFYF